jgi:two-component system, OmpR family, sensor kinase
VFNGDEGAIHGSGLGLPISQAIARAHGGLIEVSSNETVGTTFRVALPAKA